MQFKNLFLFIKFFVTFSNQISIFFHETPLTYAIEKNETELVQKLLSINGIDTSIPKVLFQKIKNCFQFFFKLHSNENILMK